MAKRNKHRKKNPKWHYSTAGEIPIYVPFLGAVDFLLFFILFLIALYQSAGIPVLIGLGLFCLLGLVLILTVNQKITYTPENFTYRDMLRISHTYSYSQIKKIRCGKDVTIHVGHRIILIDQMAGNGKKFAHIARMHAPDAEFLTPEQAKLFGGNVYNPGEFVFCFILIGLIPVAAALFSRPNVTADAFGLTFKSGNACILRGGSDSINSNIAIADVIAKALYDNGINPDVINLIKDTDRALVNQLMKMNNYVDVIIPRGGAGLIKNVVNNSTVPVIETGTGNCHVYVDEYADIDMAVKVIYNAKTSRIGVCNACESLVIHRAVAKQAIPLIVDALKKKDVEVRGDEYAMQCDSRIVPASDDDWGMEYLDYIISVKTVDSVDEAIEHINTYNTGHSESIITKDYNNANRFLDEIDAACVYVNASTRFSDGFEFGFGAEIGISTQKLHARGPMGLKALTTTKYVIYGEGQIRQ